MSSRQAMRTAQALYENGYITYMRTDSPSLSAEATNAARRQAAELYGSEYVPGAPRVYQSKSKGAQEAHEAIRPAGDSFRTPAQVAGELSGDQFRLYELIWKRTVASQMADAKGSTASVRLGAVVTGGEPDGKEAVFSASGTVISFRGFLAAYEESADADTDAADGAAAKETRLPTMAEGDALTGTDLTADGHSTSPPARYTEASLVKALEERGIGRPSTYAATISTIQDRGYVITRGQALVPTWLAFAVIRLLEEHFDRLVDYDFTATMEADLDQIAAGSRERVAWLKEFYFGETPGNTGTSDALGVDSDGGGLRALVENLGEIDAAAINSVDIGEGIRVRVGRYGPYLEDLAAEVEEGKTPPRASVPDDVAPDELTVAKARELLAAGADDGRVLGVHPETGNPVVAKNGRYGPYVTEQLPEPDLDPDLSAAAKKRALAALPKPKTASLLKTQALDSVTLEDALQLMSLPRVVGVDPESGDEITAQNGRYGPYLKKGTDSRTLPSEEAMFTVTLEEALEIYKQPKRGRGRTATPPLRELGDDPNSGKPIQVKDGRFGPYVTDGETNRTLPRDVTPESVTAERAIELLAEKRAQGPAKKRTTRTASAKKPAAKKAPAKKPAAKKTSTSK
jgi:DNA topoisomerase-1